MKRRQFGQSRILDVTSGDFPKLSKQSQSEFSHILCARNDLETFVLANLHRRQVPHPGVPEWGGSPQCGKRSSRHSRLKSQKGPFNCRSVSELSALEAVSSARVLNICRTPVFDRAFLEYLMMSRKLFLTLRLKAFSPFQSVRNMRVLICKLLKCSAASGQIAGAPICTADKVSTSRSHRLGNLHVCMISGLQPYTSCHSFLLFR